MAMLTHTVNRDGMRLELRMHQHGVQLSVDEGRGPPNKSIILRSVDIDQIINALQYFKDMKAMKNAGI